MATGQSGNPQVAAVLNEARLLITRLHDRDKTADSLLVNVTTLNEKINCMREYTEDMEELSKFTGNDCISAAVPQQHPQHGRSHLIHSLQQENRQIRLLQEENRQLKLALEEHQAALELIMQKHRRLMLTMMKLSKFQQLFEKLTELPSGSGTTVGGTGGLPGGPEEQMRLRQFASVFDECLKLGESASKRDQQELARLTTENSVLRQLLRVGSINDPRMSKLFANFVKEQASRDANLRWSVDDDEDEDDSSTPVEPVAAGANNNKQNDSTCSDDAEAEVTVIHVNGQLPSTPESPNAVPLDPPSAKQQTRPPSKPSSSASSSGSDGDSAGSGGSQPSSPNKSESGGGVGDTQTIRRNNNSKKSLKTSKKDSTTTDVVKPSPQKPAKLANSSQQNGPKKAGVPSGTGAPPSIVSGTGGAGTGGGVGGKISAFVKTSTPFGRRKGSTTDENAATTPDKTATKSNAKTTKTASTGGSANTATAAAAN